MRRSRPGARPLRRSPPACWSSSAPRATWRRASCCRRCTTWPPSGCCPRRSPSSASRPGSCRPTPSATRSGGGPGAPRRTRSPGAAGQWLARRALLRGRRLARSRDLRAAAGDARRRSRPRTAPAATSSSTSSTPPGFFGDIVRPARRGRPRPREDERRWRRVVIEKPFGHDLDSARALNREIADGPGRGARSTGSTTTWARRRCRTSWSSASPTGSSSRSGTAATSTTSRSPWPRQLGVEHRGGYYEEAGALRDMVQNHLLQLLALIAMEPPVVVRRRSGPRREGEGAARRSSR